MAVISGNFGILPQTERHMIKTKVLQKVYIIKNIYI